MAAPSLADVLKMFSTPSQLGGMNLQQAQQGLNDEIAAYSKLAEGASTRADMAQQEFQDALNAPEPGLPPAAMVQSLLGNVASAVSGDPRFGQNVQARQTQELGQIQRTRMERLSALRDRYMKLSDIAERMGNQDFMLKYNQKEGQVQKLIDAEQKRIDDARRLAAESALEGERQAGREKITGMEQAGANERAQLGLLEALIRSGKFNYDPTTKALTRNEEDEGLPIKDYETQMKNYRVQSRFAKDNKERLTLLQNIRALAVGSVSTDKTPVLLLARLRRANNPYKGQKLGSGFSGLFAPAEGDAVLSPSEMVDVIQATFDLDDKAMSEFILKHFSPKEIELINKENAEKVDAQSGTIAPPPRE